MDFVFLRENGNKIKDFNATYKKDILASHKQIYLCI